MQKSGFMTSRRERMFYCLFFLGQNILWGFAGKASVLITDVGISAGTAMLVVLLPKLWDAVNDVLFGYLMERVRFQSGKKFLPWVRIGTAALGITTVALFAIPQSMTDTGKVVWFLLAYILFDVSYTVLDAPAYALTTAMTANVNERTSIIAGSKLWGMVGGVVATLLVPMIRPKLGWFGACLVFVAVSIPLMIPMLFTTKERNRMQEQAEKSPGLREILSNLIHNKYLLVTMVAFLLLGIASVEQGMDLYMARICMGNESNAILVTGGAAASVILVSAIVPVLARKWDKFYVLCGGLIFSIVMNLVTLFVGYDNKILVTVMTMLKCTGYGCWSVVIYMMVADTVEYGGYKTGNRAAGVSFCLQTFTAKLKGALMTSVILLGLALVGFVQGEDAIQPEGVAEGIWGLFCLMPAVGFAIALVILLVFYKLRSKDVQVMAQYNNGQIDKAEAENCLAAKYGPAGEK